jgi:hypothetical protein
MGCGPSSEAGAAAGGAGAGRSGGAAAPGGKSASVAGANAGKKFGDSYKLGKEVRIMDREKQNGAIVPCRKRRSSMSCLLASLSPSVNFSSSVPLILQLTHRLPFCINPAGVRGV